jgi:hypothetical protein
MIHVTNGKFFITKNKDNCLIELFSIQGKKIMGNPINSSFSFDISMLVAGTYIVKLSVSQTCIFNDKIVVR